MYCITVSTVNIITLSINLANKEEDIPCQERSDYDGQTPSSAIYLARASAQE